MLTLALVTAAQDAGVGFLDLARLLADASPALMLAVFIVALLRRWLLLPRELDALEKRLLEVAGERDEFKAMLFRALNIGERAVAAAKDGSE